MPNILSGVQDLSIQGTGTITDYETSASERFGSELAGAFDTNPLAQGARMVRYAVEANAPFFGLESNMVSPEVAKEELKSRGLEGHITVPEGGMSRVEFDSIQYLKQRELSRQAKSAMNQSTFAHVLGFAGGLVGSAVDPINIASAFVPIVREARIEAMLAKAGSSMLGRAGVRAQVGATEGVVGALMIEPFTYAMSQYEQMDYTPADSFMNVVFGGLLGGGLHMAGGAVYDWRATRAMNSLQRGLDSMNMRDMAPDVQDEVQLDILRRFTEAEENGTPLPDADEIIAQRMTPDQRTAVKEADEMPGEVPTPTRVDGETPQPRGLNELIPEAKADRTAETFNRQFLDKEQGDVSGFSDVRPPREDIFEVAQANFAGMTQHTAKTVPIDQLSGGVSTDPAETKRVNNLVELMSGPNGYLERLIVDTEGNVIEGQHRLEALRKMGIKEVPVIEIRDLREGLPVDQMMDAMRQVRGLHREQAGQIVDQIAEAIADVGSVAEVRAQYAPPRGFERAWEAALNAAEAADDLKAQSAPAKDASGKFTEAFWRWFKDSKVVGKDGKPLVVHHHGSFDEEFDLPKGAMHFGTKNAAIDRSLGKRVDDEVMAIKTYQAEDGEWHWEDGSGATSEDRGLPGYATEDVALSFGRSTVKNEVEEEDFDFDEIGKFTDAYLSLQNPKRVADQGTNWDAAIEQAKQEGYDGIVYTNQYEDKGSTSYIAFEPTQIKSATGNRGTYDPELADIRAQSDVAGAPIEGVTPEERARNLRRFMGGLPHVKDGADYKGGGAVFDGWHGTTHDITKFKKAGQIDNFLGLGPYFTTSRKDADANYAGEGPDLTLRISREEENVADAFHSDDYAAKEMLRDYLESINSKKDVDDYDLDFLKDQYADKAIAFAARRAAKGENDGFLMKMYVKLENPADATGKSAPLTYEAKFDDNDDFVGESGTLLKWIEATREVADEFQAGPDAERYITALMEEGGDVDFKTAFDKAADFFDQVYDPDTGNSLGTGAMFREIAERAGYDGVIMDADRHFGSGRRGFGGSSVPSMEGVYPGTLHIVPFKPGNVKSAWGNRGTFDPELADIRAQSDVFGPAEKTDTPKFKRFFKQSVVTNPDGSPRVVYTGTDVAEDFTEFAPGTWFTEHPDEASAYSNQIATKKRNERAARKQKFHLAKGADEYDGQRVPYAGILEDATGNAPVVGKVYATDNGVYRYREDKTWDVFEDLVVFYRRDGGSFQYPDTDAGEMVGKITIKKGDGKKRARKVVIEDETYLNERLEKNYPGGFNARVYPVYLSIQNPKYLPPLEANRLAIRLGADRQMINDAIAKYKAEGYDGIVTESDEATMFPEVQQAFGGVPRQYIVFEPSQAKSASGNSGEYDPDVADMRAQSDIVDDAAGPNSGLTPYTQSLGGQTSVNQPQSPDVLGTQETGLRLLTGVRRSPGILPPSPAWSDTAPLAYLPTTVKVPGVGTVEAGAFPLARRAARDYVESTGRAYDPITTYRKVDPARAERIAEAFEQMRHEPDNPEVKAAYEAMVKETLAQWEAVKRTGLVVEFIDISKGDPYAASPRLATEDVRNNNHLWVFATDDGFGTDGITAKDESDNPLFQIVPGEKISGKQVRANDIFRIVHDYFGHIKDGVGFRADGEENAWRSHSRMYSPQAARAMTTETRGQNSWLNYGPYGEKNRTALTQDTIFAEQKIGLLPDWVLWEGLDDLPLPVADDRTLADELGFGDLKMMGEPLDPADGPDAPKVIGTDAAGRPVLDFRNSVVSHFTDQESADNINEFGYRVVGDVYYGEAISFTPDRSFGAQFGGVETTARVSPDARILQLGVDEDWKMFKAITDQRNVVMHARQPGQKSWRQAFLEKGIDGVYDAGAGDLFIYNERVVRPTAMDGLGDIKTMIDDLTPQAIAAEIDKSYSDESAFTALVDQVSSMKASDVLAVAKALHIHVPKGTKAQALDLLMKDRASRLIERANRKIASDLAESDAYMDALPPTDLKTMIGGEPMQPGTDKFNRWFDNSKAVDADGRPQVWLHSTTQDFDTFDISKSSPGAAYGPGIYMTLDKGDTDWARGVGHNVMPLFVKMKNPLDTTKPLTESEAAALRAIGMDWVKAGIPTPLTSMERRFGTVGAAAQAAGFDALVHRGPQGQQHLLVFNESQVKSAIGNNGNYDPDLGDIRAQSDVVRAAAPDTPEFKRWFGGSKVVDANGKPLVVYHGGRAGIEKFANPDGKYKSGIFFTDSKGVANAFGRGGETYEMYLRIERPFEVDAKGEYYSSIQTPKQMQGYATTKTVDTDLIAKWAFENGYDGVVFHNVLEGRGSRLSSVYAVSTNTQIKSATDNSGNYDPDLADIRAQSDVDEPGVVMDEDGGIEVWHGSPHDFDRFDMSKIGTGEGNQSFGRGLYFAEARAVGEEYREKLTAGARTGQGPGRIDYFLSNGKEVPVSDKRVADIAWMMKHYEIDPKSPDGEEWLSSEIGARGLPDSSRIKIAEYYNTDLQRRTVDGRLYKAKLNVRPEARIDWDVPLSDQPHVLDTLIDAFGGRAKLKEVYLHEERLAEQALANVPGAEDKFMSFRRTPEAKMANAVNSFDRAKASHFTSQKMDRFNGEWLMNAIGRDAVGAEILNKAGFKVIQYKDAGSRTAAAHIQLSVKGQPYGEPIPVAAKNQIDGVVREYQSKGFETEIKDLGSRNYVVMDDELIDIIDKFQSDLDEQPDLVAAHNLTAANLLHADRMGGIAAPSLAIAKASDGHEGYGEITLIGSKDLVDPQKGANVYAGDIYSARYPTVHYNIKYDSIRKLEKQFAATAKEMGVTLKDTLDDDALEREGPRALSNSAGAMLAYAKDKGIKVDGYVFDYAAWEVRNREAQQKESAIRNEWNAKYDAERESAQAEGREPDDTQIEAEMQPKYMQARREADAIQREPDRALDEIKYKLRDKFRNDSGFAEWADAKFAELKAKERIFKGFSNTTGAKMYTAHTLDNVVKLMTKKIRDAEGFNYGIGNLRAKVAPKFRSVEAIRGRKGSLVKREEFDAIKKEADAELISIADQLLPKLKYKGNSFGQLDALTQHMAEAVDRNNVKRVLQEYYNGITDDDVRMVGNFLQKLKTMPTTYFEAKLDRAVQIGEFEAAIVPNTLSKKAREVLERSGVKQIIEYDPAVDGARQAAIDSIRDMKFQRDVVDVSAKDTVVAGPYTYTKMDTERRQRSEALRDAIEDLITKYTGGRAQMRWFSSISQKAGGKIHKVDGGFSSLRGLIIMALDAADMVGSAKHEALHFLKDRGLISDVEWDTLVRTALREGWMDKKYGGSKLTVRQRYAHLPNMLDILEEAIAEQFRAGRYDNFQGFPPAVRAILNKLRKFFDGVAKEARKIFGQEATAEDIFRAIESGEIGRRADVEKAKVETAAIMDAPQRSAPQRMKNQSTPEEDPLRVDRWAADDIAIAAEATDDSKRKDETLQDIEADSAILGAHLESMRQRGLLSQEDEADLLASNDTARVMEEQAAAYEAAGICEGEE